MAALSTFGKLVLFLFLHRNLFFQQSCSLFYLFIFSSGHFAVENCLLSDEQTMYGPVSNTGQHTHMLKYGG